MNILLIDVDSVIPNLALMKISTYHKKKGDHVFLNYCNDPDKVYVSCILKENRSQALGSKLLLNCKNVCFGGYGINDKKLPGPIEHMMPDYSLYDGKVCQNCGHLINHCRCKKETIPGDMWYSMGYSTRGCIRNCGWCKVPEMEGSIRANASISEFLSPFHKHLVLLDNNILALDDHFKKIADQIMNRNVTVDFNQGLDIRLINDENAGILKKLRYRPFLRFAFDEICYKKQVINGIKTLIENGIKQSFFYVLVGYNTSIEEDLERLNILKLLDQRPYVMRYNKDPSNRLYSDLAAWANQQQFFMSMSFERFRECRAKRKIMGHPESE